MADVPYQQATQVAQLQAERENAVAYGQTDRVAEIDRRLADLGVKQKVAEERKAATEEKSDEPKKSAPQGRSSRPQQKAS